MSTANIGNINLQLVQWNKMGDHPLVKENVSNEFPYENLAREGCGFMNIHQVVHPGDFLLEINGHVVSILSEEKVSEIFNVEIIKE